MRRKKYVSPFEIERLALEYAPKPIVSKYIAAYIGFGGTVGLISCFCELVNIAYGDHWVPAIFVALIPSISAFLIVKEQEDRFTRACRKIEEEIVIDASKT